MTSFRPAPTWLADAVFYQICPQSFADSDGTASGTSPGSPTTSTICPGWASTPSG
ncbi:hypothetical protein WB401_24800 [Streptomyces brasiliscabiei]|uniref:Uncharacterized protein n=1 Tax=Streptomyces brasiliscabiei TaxID=2736302 RepID=A0ABU8GFF5_9ACTN